MPWAARGLRFEWHQAMLAVNSCDWKVPQPCFCGVSTFFLQHAVQAIAPRAGQVHGVMKDCQISGYAVHLLDSKVFCDLADSICELHWGYCRDRHMRPDGVA